MSRRGLEWWQEEPHPSELEGLGTPEPPPEPESDHAPCCPDPECSGNPCTFPGYAANH